MGYVLVGILPISNEENFNDTKGADQSENVTVRKRIQRLR